MTSDSSTNGTAACAKLGAVGDGERARSAISPLWTLLVVGAAFVCFTVRNGRPGHFRSDEFFYMVGGMNAIQHGEWLIPEYSGGMRLQKPPLNYWLLAGSFRLFGVGLWQARLPSALAGALCVWLTYLLGTLAFSDRRAGLYAGCILLASYAFASPPHRAMTDVVVTALMLTAVYGFTVTVLSGQRWGAVVAWVAMGAAFLQKGPIGLAAPLAGIVTWRLATRKTATVRWRTLFPPTGLFLVAVSGLPWPLLVLRELGADKAGALWMGEAQKHIGPQFGRLVGGLLYYAMAIVRCLLPWSVLLLFYRRRRRITAPALLLLFLGLAPLVVFWLGIAMLRLRYVLVSMAVFAALLGYATARLEERPGEDPVLWRALCFLLRIVPACGMLVGAMLMVAALGLVRTPAALGIAVSAIVVSACGYAAIRTLRRRAMAPHWIVAAALTIAFLQCIYWHVWRSELYTAPSYELARRNLRAESDPTVVLGLYRTERDLATVGAGRELPSLGGWSEGRTERFEWDQVARFDLVLSRASLWQKAPPALRQSYRRVDAAPIVRARKHFNPLWFLNSRDDASSAARGRHEWFVLLHRSDSSVGNRPGP